MEAKLNFEPRLTRLLQHIMERDVLRQRLNELDFNLILDWDGVHDAKVVIVAYQATAWTAYQRQDDLWQPTNKLPEGVPELVRIGRLIDGDVGHDLSRVIGVTPIVIVDLNQRDLVYNINPAMIRAIIPLEPLPEVRNRDEVMRDRIANFHTFVHF